MDTTETKRKSPMPKGGLHLTRTPGTWLKIGEAIVYFKKARGNHIELTVSAPPDVKVMRGELIEKARDELIKKATNKPKEENHEG